MATERIPACDAGDPCPHENLHPRAVAKERKRIREGLRSSAQPVDLAMVHPNFWRAERPIGPAELAASFHSHRGTCPDCPEWFDRTCNHCGDEFQTITDEAIECRCGEIVL